VFGKLCVCESVDYILPVRIEGGMVGFCEQGTASFFFFRNKTNS
jgi:hypothetical protein